LLLADDVDDDCRSDSSSNGSRKRESCAHGIEHSERSRRTHGLLGTSYCDRRGMVSRPSVPNLSILPLVIPVLWGTLDVTTDVTAWTVSIRTAVAVSLSRATSPLF
jgi:hypothetical protein